MELSRLRVGDSGEIVAQLHEVLAFHGVEVSPEERKRRFFGPSTRDAVREFQKQHGLEVTGEVDEATAAALSGATLASRRAPLSGTSPVDLGSPFTPRSLVSQPALSVPNSSTGAETDPHRLEGCIFLDYGLPAGGVAVRVYNRGFGGADMLLGEISSDSQGFYALPYDIGGKAANLEVRVVDAQGKEIPVSATKYNVDKQEVLNLVAPASVQPLAAEYHRLAADLEKQLGGLSKLADAQENTERQDITLLHQATGWDARLIALAVTAVKSSAETGITQDTLYALFRVGMPTDKQQLAQLSPHTIEKALGKAKDAGIVSLDDNQVAEAKVAFANFARTTRLAAKAPGALSSFGELLNKSGLSSEKKAGISSEQDTFADLYFAHRGSPAELWQEAEKAFGKEKTERLRLQGKLAYLTLNNVELTASLQQEIGSPDNLAQLVDRDLCQKEAWKARLIDMTDKDEQKLQKMIPPAYAGETTDDRLNAYAADLAWKMRLSFPTRVVGRMIEKDELRLGDDHEKMKAPVCILLKNAEELGFELGRTPMNAFLKQHEDKLFQGIFPDEDKVKAATQRVKTLQRLYQITPSDESLKTVFELGFTSAYDVTAFPPDVFLDQFEGRFPSREEAQLVYRKAQQVSASTYNVFTAARQIDSTPAVYAISPPTARREAAKANLIKHYPTMESLFGSLDFCECEHCRSVLSPAAYFVDLLQFLDPKPEVWQGFLDDWSRKHHGESYKSDWKNDNDQPQPQEKRTPYYALTQRRPDLPYLQLTCENTNTALPYIDIVNEILEYSIANEKLSGKAVHDTGDATIPELLAEPQNILPEAYDRLKQARYPLTLPFDLWLETVRHFFTHFETPLWQVLDVMRSTDNLFDPAANPNTYYRVAIFTEYLGFSHTDFGIFSDDNLLATWHQLYGFNDSTKTAAQNQQDGLAVLKSAKALARRLGVSYKELVDIVHTSFVNPGLDDLAIVWNLRLNMDDVVRYFNERGKAEYAAEQQAFEERLKALDEIYKALKLNAKTELEHLWKSNTFKQTLLLKDTAESCNFDQVYLQFADGRDADALVLLKVNLFVRLWRKLGWTMEETDRALRVFLPANSRPLTAANLGAALRTALLYLAHLKALDERVNVGKNSRLKLLTLWSELDTTGKNSLYAQLFLTRSVRKIDTVFDHPLGQYLRYFDSGSGQYLPFHWDAGQQEDVNTGNVALKSHIIALQAALNLTVNEVGQILTAAGKSLDTEPLTLANVSLLYRYRLLAKALRLPVSELIALKELSGLDPFKSLSPNPVVTIADDYPLGQTIPFIEVVEKVAQTGFRVEDLDYLLRHRFDPVGKYRPKVDDLLALVILLAASVHRIQEEHAMPIDPSSITDDWLRQKLALVLASDVAETLLGMWAGSVEYEAIRENVKPADKLAAETFAQEPAIRVSYDEVHQEQRLIFRGVLLDTKKQQLTNMNHSPVLAALLENVQRQAKAFFEKQLAGFLAMSDFDLLFAPIPDTLNDTEKQARLREKGVKLAQGFLPFLQQSLIRQSVVQILATSLNADPALTEALLTNANLLHDPDQPGKPLLDAFAISGERGVSAAFFTSANGTGAPLAARTVATVDTRGKPAGVNSASFAGYFEVPAAGAYRFFVVFGKKDAEAELRFTHLPNPLLRGKAANDGDEISQFVELKPGILYQFALDARSLGGADVTLLIQGENLPKDTLARLTLYPQSAVERMQQSRVLLAKTFQLIQGLGLSERELRHILTHAGDFDNLNLSKLPTQEADDPQAKARAKELFGQFLRIADYVRLKHDLAGDTDDLIGIFENARRTYNVSTDLNQAKTDLRDNLCKRIADLTRRDPKIVKAAVTHLSFNLKSEIAVDELRVEASDFAQEKGIQRLWQVLQVVEKLGVPVETLVRWTTPAPDFAIASDLRNAVKARYEEENWQRIAQPIFDKLRQRQRDALVAYIMHRNGFERIEQLFEYYLIDPGMEPVVQTSRLRLAISSVQLFIQRCLLNLEPKVHPSAINSKHWQWMKRYRVWEANRKIFLFPENWLEPEFRDDKTHLFQELESALLQGDVSNDLVEDAFFNYLKKLEELARLEIVAMYCEEIPLDPASNILHVIGRTYSLPHKYFYRRYADQMWTPWEPVTAEIEGDHLVAVVWQERLHLFWITFLEKGDLNDTLKNKPIQDSATQSPSVILQKKVDIQLNWSEYFQGQWTTRQSSGFGNQTPTIVDGNFNSSDVFIHVSKEDDHDSGEEPAVLIHLLGLDKAFRMVNKNSQHKPGSDNFLQNFQQPDPGYNLDGRQTIQYTGSKVLAIEFQKLTGGTGFMGKFILAFVGKYSLLISGIHALPRGGPVQSAIEDLYNPFFYQDNQYTFFVEQTPPEPSIAQREEWSIPLQFTDLQLDDDWLAGVSIKPEVPIIEQPIPIDPQARFKMQPQKDWVTDPVTALQFDEHLIGRGGRLHFPVPPDGINVGDLGPLVNLNLGSEVIPGSGVSSGSRLNVIGGSGLNSALLENLNGLRSSNSTRSLLGGSITR